MNKFQLTEAELKDLLWEKELTIIMLKRAITALQTASVKASELPQPIEEE